MLSALQGTDSQVQLHIGTAINLGITAGQLNQLAQLLADKVDSEAAGKARGTLMRRIAMRIKQ